MAEFHDYNSQNKLGDEHYAQLFAENGYEVLWLTEIYNHITIKKSIEVYNEKKKYHKTKFTKVDNNIYTYAPFSMFLYTSKPLMNYRFVNILSINSTIPNIKYVLEKNEFSNIDILWLTNPKYYYLESKVNYKKMFHRLADDLEEYNKKFKSFNYFEDKILQESDKVFIVSNNLIHKKKYIRDDLVYLPNGVEQSSFIKDNYGRPAEFDYNKNRCIYVGAIEKWLDVELIKYCAKKLSNINFYFIGSVKIDIQPLIGLKNVFFLGYKSYDIIPDYLYYSDIGIIPFKVNKFIDSISPIKLYEYMSVGLNVVSTGFKEMQYINSPAFIANDYNEFCNSIVQAIKSKEKNKMLNIQFAKENTWNKRFEIIKGYLP